MPFGYLDPAQQEAVRNVIQGRVVTDLGAGILGLSMELLRLGAPKVIAVDKQIGAGGPLRNIQFVETYFKDFDDPVDVAFVSWPPNWSCPGLIEAVERAEIAIYLGKNSDGTACGTAPLFRKLTKREVLVHVPAWKNTLIIYGPTRIERPLFGEEKAGIDTMVPYSFEELVYIDGHARRGHPSDNPGRAETVGEAQLRGPPFVDAPVGNRRRVGRTRRSPGDGARCRSRG